MGVERLALVFAAASVGCHGANLQNLTRTAVEMWDNREFLAANFCPVCDEDPATPIDISTIGGILFVICVGICVGTDTTLDSFRLVVQCSKRAFVCGVFSQFGWMPFYSFLLTVIFKDDMTSSAAYSYEAACLGLAIVGCLPGGNTSNLFTWFCGGNVSLSILMSLASNVAAIFMMPLLLYLYYELRFDGSSVPSVPYLELLLPLCLTFAAVIAGMLVKAKCHVETTWWTAKISSIFALVFLFLAVIIGVAKYPHIFRWSYSTYLSILSIQPMGYLAGWCFATISRCSLRDKMTIAFETGVQSFTLGLVMAQLGFNADKEACQFDPRCMALFDVGDLDRYSYSLDGDGRITEGNGVNKISIQGFLPGDAGDRTLGGCCRYNESVYLDVFKVSALCSTFYALHAFWMVAFFRHMFPRGFARCKDDYTQEDLGDLTYYSTTLATEKVEPVCSSSGLASRARTPPKTVSDFLSVAATRCKNEVALAYEWPLEPYSKGTAASRPWAQWKKWTWEEYNREVQEAARGFISLGLEEFGSVAIFGFNSPQWHVSAMAAILAGGKAAGIYPTDTEQHVIFKTRHSSADIVVVEDASKLARYKKAVDQIPKLRAVIMYAAEPEVSQLERSSVPVPVPVHSWAKLLSLGAECNSDTLELRRAALKPGQACTLVYTSGTTGMPKAVMLSHDNCCFQAQSLCHTLRFCVGVEYEQERILSYLPLSHVAGFLADIMIPLTITATTKGFATTYFARPYDLKEGSLKERLTFVRPTFFFGVPRVWEKFAEGMKAAGEKVAAMTGLRARMPILCCFRKTTVSAWAKRQGLGSARALQTGMSGKTTAFYGLAEALVLSRVRAALGLDACKICFSGAAPLATDTLEYFGSLGISIHELYGMSESTGMTTVSTDKKHLWGSVGFCCQGVQVKIFKCNDKDPNDKTECPVAKDVFNPTEAEQGEICFRGRHIMMGYLANPELGADHVADIEKKTKEAIDAEGWMHSGDMGCISETGMVRISGRYKELIITAGGENVAPVPMEDEIKKKCSAISNVMMVGDKRKYNICLVTLKTKGATGDAPGTDDLTGDALAVVQGVCTVSAARQNLAYRKVIEDAVTAANKNSHVCPSNASKIQKFEILPTDFSTQGDELTPTLKLKRKVVEAKYADIIDALYGECPATDAKPRPPPAKATEAKPPPSESVEAKASPAAVPGTPTEA